MNKDQAIYTAAKWWMDVISKKVHHDNGDNSEASLMGCLFADMLAEEVTTKQLDMFGGALIFIIKTEIEKHIESGLYDNRINVYLMCDYDPCVMLHKAAEYAMISKHNFPYKTSMCISTLDGGENFTVCVKKGYGNSFIDLNPAVDEHCREFYDNITEENLHGN